MDANNEKLVIATDLLGVMKDEVQPLPDHVLQRIIDGRTKRTQILDGSNLPQHENLVPYAYTHVRMTFQNEDDLIKCARILQWSDERMRSRARPGTMWDWKRSYREDRLLEFAVGWYSKDFFDNHKDDFQNKQHSAYYSLFGLSVDDVKIEHEIVG